MMTLAPITTVFSEIITWIVAAMSDVLEIFYTTGGTGGGSLTFLGVLAVAGLAISVFFLNYLGLFGCEAVLNPL